MTPIKVKYFKRPLAATIFLTMNCNLECKHCVYSCKPSSKHSFMSVENFRKILKKLAEEGVVRISLNGGEVTLHPFLKEILKEIYDTGISWILVTNGISLNEELARAFYRYEPISIAVSLDGPDKETHEFIRGKNTFERTLKSIMLLRKYDIDVNINTVLHRKLTIDKLIKLAEFCINNDLKIGFIGLYPKGRALKYWNKIALSDTMLYKLFKFIESNELIIKAATNKTAMSDLITLAPNTCGAARVHMAIDEHGFTYPCDLFVDTDFRGPNLLDDDITLEDVWYSPQFMLVRKILIDVIGCMFDSVCHRRKIGKCKPCPALRYSNYRNFYAPDPRCFFYPKTLGYLVKDFMMDDNYEYN